MRYLDQLRRRAPALADLLNFPGGYASSARREKFYEHRRLLRLRNVRHDLAGKKVILHGSAELLERLLRQGVFEGLDLIAACCPEGQGELLTYSGAMLPVRSEAELEKCREGVILSFSGFLTPSGDDVCNMGDEDLDDLASEGGAALQSHAERLVGRARDRMAGVFEPGNTVLFAGNVEYFNFLRISEVLRSRSMKTIFLGLTANTARFKESSFDLCLDADGNLEVFYSLLNALPFRVVHFQGWMENHEYAAAAAVLCENPVVVELNDLPHYFLAPEEYDAVFGPGHFAREDTCLKLIASHADGLLANCGQSHLDRFLDGLGAGSGMPRAPFHGYPLHRFFRNGQNPDPFSVVFPGSLLPGNFPQAAFADGHVLRLVREYVAPQNIRYHVFANPFSGDGSFERFWDYHYLSRKEPLFRLHPGMSPERLVDEISNFGFGAMFYLLDNGFKVLMEHYASLIPTKVFTMLEAGLPIIYNEEFEYLGGLAAEWGLGIHVSQDDIRRGIRPLIEGCDYPQLRKNVAAFRKAYSMESRIDDLLTVYEKAVQGSSRKGCP